MTGPCLNNLLGLGRHTRLELLGVLCVAAQRALLAASIERQGPSPPRRGTGVPMAMLHLRRHRAGGASRRVGRRQRAARGQCGARNSLLTGWLAKLHKIDSPIAWFIGDHEHQPKHIFVRGDAGIWKCGDQRGPVRAARSAVQLNCTGLIADRIDQASQRCDAGAVLVVVARIAVAIAVAVTAHPMVCCCVVCGLLRFAPVKRM